jgi:hypothetical protein
MKRSSKEKGTFARGACHNRQEPLRITTILYASGTNENVSGSRMSWVYFTLSRWHACCISRVMVKRIFSVLFLLLIAGCTKKAEVRAPEIVRTERFSYVQDEEGRWIVVALNAKDLEEAMKRIKPGPASVEKVNLWVITPMVHEKP